MEGGAPGATRGIDSNSGISLHVVLDRHCGKVLAVYVDRAVPNQFAMTMHNSALLMARYRRGKSMSKKEEPTRRIAWNVEC